MTALWMFLAAVCVLGPLVALHEWGHYIVARLCGVRVLTYSIGFGSKLFGWTSRRSNIDYRISAIPLGGYVKMLDEREGEVAPADKPYAFNNQHPLKKIAIVAAGPLMNFLIAIVLFWVLFLIPSEHLSTKIGEILPNSPAQASGLIVGDKITHINHKPVDTWEQINYALADKMGESTTIVVGVQRKNLSEQALSVPVQKFMQNAQGVTTDPLTSLGALPYRPIIAPVIAEVLQGGVAHQAGIQAGDEIVAIGDAPIDDWVSATEIIRKHPNQALVFHIQRNGEMLNINITPKAVNSKNTQIGQIGVKVDYQPERLIPDEYRVKITHTPIQALAKSFEKTYDLAKMTINSLGKMLTGLIGLENISGPITIAEVSKQSFEIGWQQVLSTAALISLSLAVLNLLPIPVLDGGHLVFYSYELIAGKAVSESLQMLALRIGMILLFCFMALAISNDISRIFG